MSWPRDPEIARTVADLARREEGGCAALLPLLRAVQARYGHVPPAAMLAVAETLDLPPAHVEGVVSFYAYLTDAPVADHTVHLCRTVCCRMAGADRVADALAAGLETGRRAGEWAVTWTNCIGQCDHGPTALVDGVPAVRLDPATAAAAVRDRATAPRPDPLADTHRRTAGHRPTLDAQHPRGGEAVARTLAPAAILDAIEAAGLEGLGGAHFPATVKWRAVAAAPDPEKIVVCNADEGEPGTFKDRVILTERPDLLVEGMAICARAVGAARGIVYLRAEYAWLADGLRAAIAAAADARPDFAIEVRLGAGAYICGEETALIASLEGDRGEAKNRPPFPTAHGFDGHPTVVNNVETLAWVPCILSRGAAWYRSATADRGARPRLFSISGDVARPGVYELGEGVSVADLLELAGGRGAKAVQVGGAAGHLLPPSEFDVPDLPRRAPRGGAVIVYGAGRDLVAMVGDLMAFFADESCGQCTPCRLGTRRLESFVDRLRHGRATAREVEATRSLMRTMRLASKCGLGQTAPNALADLLDRFPDELPTLHAEALP